VWHSRSLRKKLDRFSIIEDFLLNITEIFSKLEDESRGSEIQRRAGLGGTCLYFQSLRGRGRRIANLRSVWVHSKTLSQENNQKEEKRKE
jgi:hypothetical protein